MSLKGLLFIGIFGFCAAGALFLPQLGVYGYIADYCINPSGQWWGAPFANMGLRMSLTLAMATLVGMVLQKDKLRFGEKALHNQEIQLLVFLGLIWLLTFLGPETVGRYTVTDHPSIKLTKITIFALIMTHVITDIPKLSGLFWVLTSASLMLGIKAWDMPYRRFIKGRLEGIGGSDFNEANFFAAFMAAMLPIIAVQLLRSRKWYGKVFCFLSGAFTANAVILCRSRGAFLGLAVGGLVSCFVAPKRHRKIIVVLLIAGIAGFIYLSDESFINRVSTITTEQEEMDKSASSRIELWKTGAQIFSHNPLGIGPGNWYQSVGRFNPDLEGKDSHNTYVKCLVELGVLGTLLFFFLLWQSYRSLRFVHDNANRLSLKEADTYTQYYFAILVSLVIILACGMTITMIYVEIVWLLLMLPVCLRRAFENRLRELESTCAVEVESSLVPAEPVTGGHSTDFR
jgi:probable O-glycosylation ligase (exosortase A-associated)